MALVVVTIMAREGERQADDARAVAEVGLSFRSDANYAFVAEMEVAT